MKKKRGTIWQTLPPWLIALAVLAIILVFAWLLKDQLFDLARYIKELFRR